MDKLQLSRCPSSTLHSTDRIESPAAREKVPCEATRQPCNENILKQVYKSKYYHRKQSAISGAIEMCAAILTRKASLCAYWQGAGTLTVPGQL